ncbi:MAG: hypothetical protein SF187_30740 [Deltaproteobacteria bacterium]|nr:hypothetical protein [Deltaproteobacteria bacterium]
MVRLIFPFCFPFCLRRLGCLMGVSVLVTACAPAPAHKTSPQEGFGHWLKDPQGLPAYELEPRALATAPYAPFAHLISAGRAGALADRWGNIRLITTEGGTTTITPVTTRTRGGLFALLETANDVVSLAYSELPLRGPIRYGTGYATYEGGAVIEGQRVALTQEVVAVPQDVTALAGSFSLTNQGAKSVHATFVVQSDVFVRPGVAYADFVKTLHPESSGGRARFTKVTPALGNVYLRGPLSMAGSTRDHSLRLSVPIDLAPGQSFTVPVSVGYGDEAWAEVSIKVPLPQMKGLWLSPLQRVQALWAPSAWMIDEAVWSFGQMLSFRNRDASTNAPYYQLGGYSMFRNPDNPEYLSFPVREAPENALAMAPFAPAAAADALRWIARGQLQSGDIPKTTNLRAERDLAHMHFESDGEIWFLLASAEQAAHFPHLFNEDLPFWDGTSAPYFDHLARAFTWLRHNIGVGTHGLVLMKDGDWNDYLSRVGRQGRGESFMNTAMAVRACEGFAVLARKRGAAALADEASAFATQLRAAAAHAWNNQWFLMGYDDEGAPLGDDRLYLNSQVWAALGKIGTPAQRQQALRAMLKLNASTIGLTLLSRPYASPPPPHFSFAVLPAGEGENGGIWPQTVYWAVWALAQEGLWNEAVDVWQRMSLRNHSARFPQVPFGIFNGPDCYSSAMAGPAEGWTQVQVFDRMVPAPMNPIVGWQAFALEILGRTRPRP